ncbi:hypothetical protein L1286_10715 [Pseudoalteromonas sp. SMS1]|uniref:M61 family metallopeptidase n=1 Tax=Pseudoalteromonas sp. SMS1 TaxID=2908894 RepID=UPI001F17112D|nr:hypothetical protein [Pseudoalteromonas sp. SMS1]MCF2857944.1 hypothetical protein [Pseudoalteromonas sp. SMS1]
MGRQGVRFHYLSKLFCLCLLLHHVPSTGNVVIAEFRGSPTSDKYKTSIEGWLNTGHNAVVKTLGPVAQEHIPIQINVTTTAQEAVPWGEVIRGKLDSIELRVNKFSQPETLSADWTLYHELSHLYHPLFAYPDFWLAEGFATYFQNIVMLQNGIYSQDEFIRRMRDGLARGQKSMRTYPGRLDTISSDMWRLRAYQRVYWSGVGFFIEAEHTLRKVNAKYTISELISHYQRCCRGKEREGHVTSAQEFVTALDNLSGHKVFNPLYQRYRRTQSFPQISNEQLKSLIHLYTH